MADQYSQEEQGLNNLPFLIKLHQESRKRYSNPQPDSENFSIDHLDHKNANQIHKVKSSCGNCENIKKLLKQFQTEFQKAFGREYLQKIKKLEFRVENLQNIILELLTKNKALQKNMQVNALNERTTKKVWNQNERQQQIFVLKTLQKNRDEGQNSNKSYIHIQQNQQHQQSLLDEDVDTFSHTVIQSDNFANFQSRKKRYYPKIQNKPSIKSARQLFHHQNYTSEQELQIQKSSQTRKSIISVHRAERNIQLGHSQYQVVKQLQVELHHLKVSLQHIHGIKLKSILRQSNSNGQPKDFPEPFQEQPEKQLNQKPIQSKNAYQHLINQNNKLREIIRLYKRQIQYVGQELGEIKYELISQEQLQKQANIREEMQYYFHS